MKKLLLLFAAILMASTGLWAETVSYRYPVYNTEGVPTDGIKEWKTAEVNATVVTSSGNNVTWGKTGETTWYVVNGTNVVLSEGVICQGDVRLILADGAKFTATGRDIYCDPGIQVSGEGNSLTIYGQTNQTGQLIANGDMYGAGIGGGKAGSGSNITINGGMVTANGASYAAGIGGGYNGSGSNITINGGKVTANGGGLWAAGIGGGNEGSGSNITINGGTVTANGGDGAAAIGSGYDGAASSNIFVATRCIVKADGNNPPTTVIENTGTDLAGSLAGKQYATVETPKYAVTYGDNITASFMFASGAEIDAGTPITFTAADRTADGCGLVGFYEESTFDTPITTGVNGQTYTVTVTDAAISVYARYNPIVSYVYPVYNDPKDVTKGVKEWKTGTAIAYEVTSSDTPVIWGKAGETTWYIVKGNDVTLSQGAICAGNVNLILADGAKLTATGEYEQAGIEVSGGNSLAIFGQTAQSGVLNSTGGLRAAGIGGHGESGSGSNITINGGIVTAEGGADAAGIGGGGNFASGSNITINGGTVTAKGGLWGAGIGGGCYATGSNITINGGIVSAKGVAGGAGIGGGKQGSGSHITINGGTVTALGDTDSAGIGGGVKESGSDITINGGTVTARGGVEGCSGIGGGFSSKSESSNIFVTSSLLLKAGDSEEPDGVVCSAVRDHNQTLIPIDVAGDLTGKSFVIIEPVPAPEEPKEVTYIDEKGIEQTVKAEVLSSSSVAATWGEPDKTTWYVVTNKNVKVANAVCLGDVRLILADGAKLNANGYSYILSSDGQKYYSAGIQVSGEDNSLTIYDQAEHTGQLVAFGAECSAGIGGIKDAGGSNITINGGIVTATGGDGEVVEVKGRLQAIGGGAGIGGGHAGSGSNITINGGMVTANGGDGEFAVNGNLLSVSGGAAGIGGGDGGAGSNITINGGTVTANGGKTNEQNNQCGYGGAGIGGGNGSSGSNIIINDGTVTANGGSNGAGIGGGYMSSGSNITINGGVVTATGVRLGVGIGGGYFSSASNITINGGIVTAIGKDFSAGIGCSTPELPISGIFVSPVLTLKAGPTANPTNVIENTGGDLAEILNQYHYITVSDAVCNITANQDPNNKKHYYSTFYSGKKAYTVPEGVTAYTGVVDGNVLRLTAIADGIIPAGEPVILRLTTEDKTETLKKFALTATTTTATKSTTNKLKGTDVPIAELGTNDYALTLGQDGVGFYQWDGNKIDAHKAYLTLTASAGANAFVFQFEDGETTGILKPVMDEKKAGPAYNLNGVRVNDNYKGIVIKNGKMIYKKK